jgi:hypothetical protein
MTNGIKTEPDTQNGDLHEEPAIQPFLYEIRVRGSLSDDLWKDWFDNLSISPDGEESVLRGSVPDHAALYGLLARLRDLAIPLIAVNVLDAEAQRKLYQQRRRNSLLVNILFISTYLLLVGGLSAVTTFLASDRILHVALALALLFAVLGGLAFVFSIWSGNRAWRWLIYGLWPSSIISFLIYVAVVPLVHPALAIALILFVTASGLAYLIHFVRNRLAHMNDRIIEWETLGSKEKGR